MLLIYYNNNGPTFVYLVVLGGEGREIILSSIDRVIVAQFLSDMAYLRRGSPRATRWRSVRLSVSLAGRDGALGIFVLLPVTESRRVTPPKNGVRLRAGS